MARRDPVREWYARELTDEQWMAAEAGLRAHNVWKWDRNHGDQHAWARDVAKFDAAAIHFWEVWAVVGAALEEWMKNNGPRITEETLKVLAVVAHLGEATPTGQASGTVTPILQRLEEVGWLARRVETGDPHQLGRPLRVFYRVADEAAVAAMVKPLLDLVTKLAEDVGCL
jgi:DNA-binding MarR family transcriptional regulator